MLKELFKARNKTEGKDIKKKTPKTMNKMVIESYILIIKYKWIKCTNQKT